MKLTDVKIDRRKLTEYLLVWRAHDDKSGYLAIAGFTLETADQLLSELARLAADGEAKPSAENEYGKLLSLDGQLEGPSGRTLAVRTIWIERSIDLETHFVTLIPLEESA